MNVLYFCADSGIPFWGAKGGSVHMREFVSNFKEFGHSITVVAKGGAKNAPNDTHITYHDLPVPSTENEENLSPDNDGGRQMIELARFGHNRGYEAFLRDLHTKTKFDIIYERYSLFSVAGLKFARAAGLPFVLEVNAPLVEEAGKYRSLALKDLAVSIEQRLYSEADHIIAVSDEIADHIRIVAREAKVTVVPNGVTVERFANIEKRESIAPILAKLKKSDFVVGFVGSLKPWHGVEILIDSFANLSDDGSRCKLLIVGGKGKQKNELKQKCLDRGLKGKIKFTGFVEHDDIPALLERSDVLVAPYPNLSDFYFSALKIFEYMAAGKPIVASSIGQIDEILSHEKNALLVSAGDESELTGALERLRRDPELREKLGKNARKEAIEKHTWNHRLIEVDNIFKELVSGSELVNGRK